MSRIKKVSATTCIAGSRGHLSVPVNDVAFGSAIGALKPNVGGDLKMQSMMVAFRAAMTRPGEMQKPCPAAKQPQPPAKTEH